MNSFWIDSKRNLNITYDVFFQKIIEKGINNIYVKYDNPYAVFLNLIRNSISGKKSIILDYDFSNDELLSKQISKKAYSKGEYIQNNLSEKFKSFNDILLFIEENRRKLEIDVYTSGTTGTPKKITQPFKNLIRAVKVRDTLKDNVWGFAYNPTHFAGLQVFFQALFNTNTIVYLFEKKFNEVYFDFVKYEITHISCTPTFMKMFLPSVKKDLIDVRSITFGGEKFDSKIEKELEKKFSNATVKNIYASTEAGSLLKGEGEFFLIPKRYNELIKIKNNELLIHKELLGASESFNLVGDWYNTGDIVEFKDEKRFKFINRKSEIINVGGYNVNPFEVESIIKEIIGVKDVIVFGRDNSVMGKIVVAHVIKNENEDKQEVKDRIKKVSSSKLQDYKLPRLIKFVDSFDLTRTGKIKKQ